MTRQRSLRRQLLLGILLPTLLLIGVNTYSLYHQALAALNTAYDRTLLASAKTIGEQLDVDGYDEHARIHALVPYSALEAFEADTHTRLYYRVSLDDGHRLPCAAIFSQSVRAEDIRRLRSDKIVQPRFKP